MKSKLYNVTLSRILDRNLHDDARRIGVTTSEAFRRALVLFFAAAKADEVILEKDGRKIKVLIK